jgi:hypothetical protein
MRNIKIITRFSLAMALVFSMAFTLFAVAADEPSSWAAPSVYEAIDEGLVPQNLQSGYTQEITRAEFCALAVAVYEAYTETVITERKYFPDTDDINVEKMAGLGVVSGSGGNFNPSGTFNREMAAVLFVNLLNAMDIVLDQAAATFGDSDKISNWAAAQVGQVQAAGLIQGSGGSFNPKGEFTRESGIVLILNLWIFLDAFESELSTATAPSSMQLSDKDMLALKDSYDNLIRYNFEQFSLPASMLIDNDEIIKAINAKSKEAADFAKYVWNMVVISRIIDIQINSETTYVIDASMDLEKIYLDIVRQARLEASDYFDVSFETLRDGNNMMLLTFKKTDTLMACKYIGIVVRPNGTVRYFTAETSFFDDVDGFFFCEVTTSGRGTIGLVGFEREDFISAANIVLAGN